MTEIKNTPRAMQWISGIKDLSIIVSIISLAITINNTTKESKRVSQNTAVAKTITITMQRINQDIIFRNSVSDQDISSILQEYSKIATGLAPNDPFVTTYGMFTRLVFLARNPKTEDANELLALSIFPEELRINYPEYGTMIDGVYEDWLLYSGVGMLNLIVKGRSTSKQQEISLFDRSFQVLESALSKAIERDDQRRILSVGSVLVQHALRGAQFGLPPKGSWDKHLKICEDAINALVKINTDMSLITAYDGKADILHIKGQYFHVQREWGSAIRYYQESLSAYDELALKFPQRANNVDVALVKSHLADANIKRVMGSN